MKVNDNVTIMVTLDDPKVYRGDYGTVIEIDGDIITVETNQESIHKVVVELRSDQVSDKLYTLRELLQMDLNLPDESFGGHASDLYVLRTPEVLAWLYKNYKYYKNVTWFTSNVSGQSWYGKQALDIPFANMDYYTRKSLSEKVKERL